MFEGYSLIKYCDSIEGVPLAAIKHGGNLKTQQKTNHNFSYISFKSAHCVGVG
jgi:hypothetical protein